MLIPSSTLSVALLSLVMTACSRPPSPQESARVAEAAALVGRFITADTAGDEKAAGALVLPLGGGTPFCELATDGDDIAASAAIIDTVPFKDKVKVVVAYQVLGRAWTEDPHRVGPNDARFRRAPHTQIDTFYVVHDSGGRLGISCEHRAAPNHPTPVHWSAEVARFDRSSRAAWDSIVPPMSR
jgi:hypothetical protein